MDAGGQPGRPDATEDAVASFGAVYRRLSGQVRGFVRRQVPDHQVDDVVAETFLVVWRRWADLCGSPDIAGPPGADPALLADRLRPWVYGVARNKIRHAHDQRRRSSLVADRVAGQPERPAPDPADQLAGDDRARRLVALLPTAEADAMTLTIWGGLTPTEAAHELGCSVTALTSRLSRARARLADILGHDREGVGG